VTTGRPIAERYDASAARYERWWAPVLRETALGLLESVDRALDGGAPEHVLDVGAGTGTLTRAAARRWPNARITALDASAGMLRTAEALADEDLRPEDRARIEFVVAGADRMPLPDATADLVVSSFVLQLVPDRFRTLREIRRVLRAGGRLGWVTWLAAPKGERWLPDEAFDDAVAEMQEETMREDSSETR